MANKERKKDFKEYMDSKSGLFTALGVFIALMIFATSEFNLISVGGFFISFIIISYLLKEINMNNSWDYLIYSGYNILFVGMFIYGIKNMLSGIYWLDTLIKVCILGFYGFVSISKLLQALRLLK